MKFETPNLSWSQLQRDPRMLARIGLGVLLLANLIALYGVYRPWGGSPEELQEQLVTLQQQIQTKQTALRQMRTLTAKVEKARTQGDSFLQSYFLDRRTAASSIVGELDGLAKKTNIKSKERTFTFEPIEGTDTLTSMVINAGFEGSYADLLSLVHEIDRSPRFLILETLSAAPTQQPGRLNIVMKLHTFVRREAGETT